MEETLTEMLGRMDEHATDATAAEPGVAGNWLNLFTVHVREDARCMKCDRATTSAILRVPSIRLRFRADQTMHTVQYMVDNPLPETRLLTCLYCDEGTPSEHTMESRVTETPPRLLIHIVRELESGLVSTAVGGLTQVYIGGEQYGLRCVGAHKRHVNVRERHFVAFEYDAQQGSYNLYDDSKLSVGAPEAAQGWLPYVLVYERLPN